MALVVGLTGGIGSGKSTVCRCFAQLGVPYIDADEIARELVRPGTPLLEELVGAFGTAVRAPDGTLRRDVLRRAVFSGGEGPRRKLEALLHPPIRAEIERRLEAVTAPYCVVCIPLLVECGWQDLVDRVLVVDLPESLQRDRALARGGLTAEALQAIMRAQATRETRLAAADDVISNDGDLASLKAQVRALHAQYLRLARLGAGRP